MNRSTNLIRNILLSIFLITSILSGCSKDTGSSSVDSTNTPNIVNVTYSVDEKVFVVEATDDKGIEGYLLTLSSEKPELDDSHWKTSEELSVSLASRNAERNINYYIWVKDSDGNLSSHEFYLENDIVYLAEYYNHLAWYLDESTTKTVDGVSYDLVALKQQYGDLYRFVEPLSEEEVNDRFQYLAEFFQIQVEDGYFEEFRGGIADMSQECFQEFVERRNIYHEEMGTTDEKELFKYISHYPFVQKIERYTVARGGTFGDVRNEYEILNIVNQFTFEEKDWFVRHYMTEADILLRILDENNEAPNFNFKASQKTD